MSDRTGELWVPARTGLLAAGAAACVLLAGCSSGASARQGAASPPPAAKVAQGATGHVGKLTITGSYVPQPASTDVAAAYLTIANTGSTSDTLVKVVSSVTSNVMAMTETSSGTTGSMTDLGRVTVPAHGTASFTPGHAHLMLQKPQRQLKQGERITLTLTFAKAGTVTLDVPVASITGSLDGGGKDRASMPGMGS